jgi:hypothetical protein
VIATTADALAILARAGAMSIVPTCRAIPSLVVGVVGAPIRGSWWSHPEGKRIFRIATELEDSGRVLAAKLVDGKIVLLERAHWPAWIRVVTDRAWRAPRIAALAADAKRLLAKVEKEDVRGAPAKPRRALEDALLVYARSEHTDRGAHETIVTTWARGCPPAIARAAAKLTRAKAEASLARVLDGPLP